MISGCHFKFRCHFQGLQLRLHLGTECSFDRAATNRNCLSSWLKRMCWCKTNALSVKTKDSSFDDAGAIETVMVNTNQVDDTLDLFNELQMQHQAVATKTKTLHDAYDRLLQEKQRLIDFAEALHSKLNYFDELENVATNFYSPNMNVGNEGALVLDACPTCNGVSFHGFWILPGLQVNIFV